MLIHKFDSDSSVLSEVGGKAQSLIEATRAGFSVPDGFVMAVEFFQPWLDQIKATPAWTEFIATTGDDIRNQCDAVKAACAKQLLADDRQQALNAALAAMGDITTLAVRSSSPEEDLEGTSFAGGYETTLGVTRATLLDAIRHSFASLFDERVVKYKAQAGMAVDQPRIAIVVQRQIASDASGVAFSLNPQNNCYDEAVINANFGLGESVVEGLVTPDAFVVDQVSGNIIDKKIANKNFALWLNEDGGVREQAPAQPDSPCLSDEQALQVAQLAGKAQSHYGKPMDIEWAYEGERLFLLQSRPITSWIPLPQLLITEPGEQKMLYLDMIVLTQGFSDPLSPLGASVWGPMLEAIKGDVGLIDRGTQGTVVSAEGRQYLHLSNMSKAMSALIAGVIKSYDSPTRRMIESIDIKKDYMPAQTPEPLKGLALKVMGSVGAYIGPAWRGLTDSQRAEKDYLAGVARDIATCRDMVATRVPFDQMLEKSLALFAAQMDSAVSLLVPAGVAQLRVKRLFRKDNVDDDVLALQMDLNGNPTAEMGRMMYQLAAADELQVTAAGEQFARRIEERDYSAEFLALYDDYIDRFGCRGIKEIDIATPRVWENPAALFDQLKAIDLDSQVLKSAHQRRTQAYERLRELAKSKGKEEKFEQLARAQANFGYREAPKYFFVVAVDLMRRRALEIGHDFVEAGRLDSVYDVFNLSAEDLTAASADSSLDLRASIETNLAPRRRAAGVRNWPRVIDSRGKIFHDKPETVEGGVVGDPIAPGVVRGRAKVLNEPYEKPLEPGEILITRASDPGWTPIFINAAAVVLEVGGALQHGAIIAREYGLPCVSGINGVTELFHDGQMLEVDGSNGIVRVVDEVDGVAEDSAEDVEVAQAS